MHTQHLQTKTYRVEAHSESVRPHRQHDITSTISASQSPAASAKLSVCHSTDALAGITAVIAVQRKVQLHSGWCRGHACESRVTHHYVTRGK
jgi:hypothetical protein